MKALITGVTGQDGYYLARLLTEQGFEVLGLSRGLAKPDAAELPPVHIATFDYDKRGAFSQVVESFRPDYVFNLAALATGRGMFESPELMSRLNAGVALDILEAIRTSPRCNEIRFCQASSSEMFGDTNQSPQREDTPFRPKSPYGAAKLYAHNMVGIYRANFGVRGCSAILYNHESVRRSTDFVTMKIARAVAEIKLGATARLKLGSLSGERDWGYAPEYAEAMLRMATADTLADYVVGTGVLTTVRRLCEIAFGCVGLDYRNFVEEDVAAQRAVNSVNLLADPSKIRNELGWHHVRSIDEIMVELVEHQLKLLQAQSR
jgi:GDPmannose 4,6-dehydratase